MVFPRRVLIINSDGTKSKEIVFPSQYGGFVRATTDHQGNYFVIGNFCSLDFKMGSIRLIKTRPYQNAVFLLKFDSDDHLLWGKMIEGERFISFSNSNYDNTLCWYNNNNLFLHLTSSGNYIISDGKSYYFKDQGNSSDSEILLSMDNSGGHISVFASLQNWMIAGFENQNLIYAVKNQLDYYDSSSGKIFTKGWMVICKNFSSYLPASDDQLTDEIMVYPNPSPEGKFTINDPYPEANHYEIFDIKGNLILKTGEQKFDLSKYPKGIYFLKTEQNEKVIKLIYR